MKTLRVLHSGLFMLILVINIWGAGPVHVNSYTRSDGTFVRAHTRALPGTGSSGNSGSGGSDYMSYTGGGIGDYTGEALITRDTDPNVVLAKSGKHAFRATRELFAKLRTGMGAKDVFSLLGPPTKFTSGEWSYDGIGWLGFSATDRVTIIRTAEVPKIGSASVSANYQHNPAVKHCAGKTKGGASCRNLPESGSDYCKLHKPAPPATPSPKP